MAATAEREGRLPRVGALCVIDPQADGRRVYDHLCRDLGFRSVDFLVPFMNWADVDDERLGGVKRFLEDAFGLIRRVQASAGRKFLRTM